MEVVMNRLVLLALCATALLLVPGRHEAGIHGPADFGGYVDTGPQRGLLFWDNGRQEMVIQPGWTIATATLSSDEYNDDGLLRNFDALAWVIPLPSVPDSYKVVEPDLFDELDTFTSPASRVPEPEGGSDVDDGPVISDGSETAEVELYEVVDVGDYSIQALKARGEAGGKELQAWFRNNGFGSFDERVLRWYNANDYCWLVIKATVKNGLPPDGTLKPLHISFRTARPCYPFKAYDKRGTFNLELYVITRHALDLTKSRAFGLETPEQQADHRMQPNRQTSFVKLPETVRAIADGSEDLKELRVSPLHVYRFSGRNIEHDDLGIDLAILQDELHFEFEKDVSAKPKTEVKPSEEPKEEGEEGSEKDPETKPETDG
jgi:hypothetical protein